MSYRKLVSYLQLSTDKQGKSGLGFEAQRATIVHFAEAEDPEPIGAHIEIETGRTAVDRWRLGRAIAARDKLHRSVMAGPRTASWGP